MFTSSMASWSLGYQFYYIQGNIENTYSMNFIFVMCIVANYNVMMMIHIVHVI